MIKEIGYIDDFENEEEITKVGVMDKSGFVFTDDPLKYTDDNEEITDFYFPAIFNDNYSDYIEDAIEFFQFVEEDELEIEMKLKIKSLTIEDISNFDFTKEMIKEAKKIIIKNMEYELYKLKNNL